MQHSNSGAQKRQASYDTDALEMLKSMPAGVAKTTLQTFGDIGAGMGQDMLDTFLGAGVQENNEKSPKNSEHAPGNFQKKVEFKRLYDFQAESEKNTIKELLKKIHDEIHALKQANSSLAQEVKDIEKVTLSSADEKPGVYHIRFLELVLSFIQTLKAKVNESSTWLQAIQSKKKKRGSAFAVRSKKSGTSYSQSEEHKLVRSTQ